MFENYYLAELGDLDLREEEKYPDVIRKWTVEECVDAAWERNWE